MQPARNDVHHAVLDSVEVMCGIQACSTAAGTTTATAHLGDWARVDGVEQVGSLGPLLDLALCQEVFIAGLPALWTVTTELQFTVLVEPPWHTDLVTATAQVLGRDASGGYAQAEVRDPDGRTLVTAGAWVQHIPAPAEPTLTPITAHHRQRRAGNLVDHLGAKVGSSAAGTEVSIADPYAWTNRYQLMHGGIWTALAELAASTEFARTGKLRTATFHVALVRPASLAGPIRAVVRPDYLGRRFGVVTVTGVDAEGETCVIARVTGRDSRR